MDNQNQAPLSEEQQASALGGSAQSQAPAPMPQGNASQVAAPTNSEEEIAAKLGGKPQEQTQGKWVTKDPEVEAAKALGGSYDAQKTEEAHYTAPGQKGIAALEGAGKGVAGFLSPLAERGLGVPAEDITKREEYNPYTAGTAEAAGLIGSSLAGVGLGHTMGLAGEAATHAARLGTPVKYAARVGSAIVDQAVQMAVLQGSNEIAKTVLNEPTSVESAVANIGTAAAIGGATGGFVTGVASPLWKAAGGEAKLEQFLTGTRNHLNSGAEPLPLPEASNTMELVHLSPGKHNVIDPKFAGTGVDAGVKGRSLEEPLSHYYIKGAPRSAADAMVKGNEHSVVVDLAKDKIYDYGKDPEGIVKAAKEANGGAFNLDVANGLLKKNGYSGFMVSNNPDNMNTVMMFKPMPVRSINGVPTDNLPKNFSMISAQVGSHPNPEGHFALRKELEANGFKVDEAAGHYGHTPEPSLMVQHDGSPAAIAKLDALGKQFGQESVIHSTETNASPRHNELHYMNGKIESGDGALQNPKAATNYTYHPQLGKFQLNIGAPLPLEAPKVGPIRKILGHKNVRKVAAEVKEEAVDQTSEQLAEQAKDPESMLHKNLNTLGIDLAPALKGGMSGSPDAALKLNKLREVQHPQTIADLNDMKEKVSNSITGQIPVPLEDVAHHSENESGNEVYSTFEKEYNRHYEPVAKEMEMRNKMSAPIRVPDEARRDFGGQLIENGMQAVGTDSPYYKTYEHYAQRVMAKDTIGDLDKLKTELYNKAKSLSVDNNEKQALHSIRNAITDFQEKQIADQGVMINNEGLLSSEDAISQRLSANRRYASFADMSTDLSDHLGVGNFRGAGSLKDKLEGMAPESLLKKFSPRGNVDSIPFLQKYFPETAKRVQEAEMKKFLAPAVYTDKGQTLINVDKLSKMVERLNKTSPEYANFVLPKEVQKRLSAGKAVLDAVPDMKSSGTAGWLTQLTKNVAASAMSTVGYMTGHNPVSSYILGEIGQRMSRDIPDAIRYAFLKQLGSKAPVNAAAFKTMTETIHASMKGEERIAKAVSGVLKTGIAVTSTATPANREKLDKIVTEYKGNPNKVDNIADNNQLGHYMPEHQAVLSSTLSNQVKYLDTLRPKPRQAGPLDKPIEPTAMEKARYNRALDIANDPVSVMEKVKDGSIQPSDIQDLKNLYPSLYPKMQQQLLQNISEAHANEETIPYTTKMGLSLFLVQPLDSTMNASSIMAAQPVPKPPPEQSPMKGSKGAPGKLGKDNNSYKTTTQAAEGDRSNRD